MKLVLFDRSINSDTVLCDSFKSECILRDIEKYDTVEKILNSVNITQITNLAFVYHNTGTNVMPFFYEKNHNGYINENVITLLSKLQKNCVVDFLSCELGSTKFIKQVEILEKKFNISIRYSNEKLGNGNWVLSDKNRGGGV